MDALAEMVDAVNAGDASRYARVYAEDAVITIHGAGVLTGRAAIEGHEIELLRQFPGARLGFHAVWRNGPSAVVHYAVDAQIAGGGAMGHEGLLFYQFHPSALIAAEHRYMDSLTPMSQLGLLGPRPARPLPSVPTEMQVYITESSPQERANVICVRATLAALDARDETAFLSSFADGAVLDEMIDPHPDPDRQSVGNWFRTWTNAVPDARTELTAILGVRDFVLLETIVRGTLKGPLGHLSGSDRGFAVHRAAVVQAQESGLTRMTWFMNGKELAEATGQWPL